MVKFRDRVSLNIAILSIGKMGNYVAAALLFLLMLLISVHVIGRYFLSQPLPGAVELIQYLMVGVGSLGFASCAAKQGHVRVLLLVERLPLRIQKVLKYIALVISFGMVSLLAWQTLIQAINIWQSRAVSGALRIPQFPFTIILTIAFAIFAVELLAQVFRPSDDDFEEGLK